MPPGGSLRACSRLRLSEHPTGILPGASFVYGPIRPGQRIGAWLTDDRIPVAVAAHCAARRSSSRVSYPAFGIILLKVVCIVRICLWTISRRCHQRTVPSRALLGIFAACTSKRGTACRPSASCASVLESLALRFALQSACSSRAMCSRAFKGRVRMCVPVSPLISSKRYTASRIQFGGRD